MKNYFEAEVFVIKPKSFTHAKGTGSNFSFMMQGQAQGENQDAPIVWFSGVCFNTEIKERTTYLLRGYLQVQAAYGDRPPQLQLVASEAIELKANQYVVRTKRLNPQETVQAPNASADVPTHTTNAHSDSYQDPVAAINPASNEIPM